MAPVEVWSFRRSVLRRDTPRVLLWGFLIYLAATVFDSLDRSNARVNLVFEPSWTTGEAQGWFAVTLTGAALSFVLLRVRHIGIDALGLATEQVRESALRDPLTGLLNRRGLAELAEPLRGLAHRQGMPAFAIMLDVDGLKAANDEYGHEFGDEVIMAVARALTVSVREADLVCRWGGDEFVVLGVGAPWPVDEFERRVIRAAAATGIDPDRWTPRVTAGTAMHERGDWDVQGLLREADAAMYERRMQLRGGA